MSHMIAKINGVDQYIGRQAAWHALGNVTGHYMTWAEIMSKGVMNFDVYKRQLALPMKDGSMRLIEAYATFRLDPQTREPIMLGTVGKDYKVIQHSVGMEMSDKLIGSIDGAHYETAGVLQDGNIVWGLADLNLSFHVGDEPHKNYLLFTTSHDGSVSFQFKAVDECVVCNNTLRVALSEKTTARLSVRHTKNAQTKIADIGTTLDSLQNDLKTVEEKLQFLATKKVNKETFEKVMERVFPVSKNDDGEEKESSTRRNNILSQVLANYESNNGDVSKSTRGSAYNLLNAITEYTDHQQSGDRAESALFGAGDVRKAKAMSVIYEMAGGLPQMQTRVVYGTAPSSFVPKQGLLDDVLANAGY